MYFFYFVSLYLLLTITRLSFLLTLIRLFGGIGFVDRVRSFDRQGTRIDNNDILNWLVTSISSCLFDCLYNAHAFNDFSENDVTSIEPTVNQKNNKVKNKQKKRLKDKPCSFRCDEKLTSVGVFSGIGHAQPSGSIMAQLEVLVLETFAIDWTTSGSVTACKVSSLNHEFFDHAMEFAALVSVRRIIQNF